MSNFNPTHEFQGLKLRYEYDYDVINGVRTQWFSTEDGGSLCLRSTDVTKLSYPKPGEVWITKLYREIRVVSSNLKMLDTDGLECGDLEDVVENNLYTKLLNADGTPA